MLHFYDYLSHRLRQRIDGFLGQHVDAPTVTSISPTSVIAGSGQLALTVNGTGFLSTTTVQVGGIADATTFVSSTQITATVTPQQLMSGSQLSVIALNGTASSGSGAAINLQVNNPVPTIAALTPSVAVAGATPPTLVVTGTGFVPTTVIDVNASPRTTIYVSTTQINVTLTAADVATVGSLSLTAVNAAQAAELRLPQQLQSTIRNRERSAPFRLMSC